MPLPVITESVSVLKRRLRESRSPDEQTKLRLLLRIKRRGTSSEADLAALSGLDTELLSRWLHDYESGGLNRMLTSGVPGEVDDSIRPPFDLDHEVEGVRLFKSSHYVGNYMELADILLDIIYDLLPGTRFTLRAGQSVSEAFSLSELSIVDSLGSNLWSLKRQISGPPPELTDEPELPLLSDFWRLLYDLSFNATGDFTEAAFVVNRINALMNDTVHDAHGNQLYPALYELQLKVAEEFLPQVGVDLAFDDLLLILRGFQTIRELLDKLLPYAFGELFAEFPLAGDSEGWNLRIDGVFEVEIPQDPKKFFTWSCDRQLFLTIRLEQIVFADESAISIFNPKKKGGETRFPLGGSVGDITLSGLSVTVKVGGQLSSPFSNELGPYHRFQQVYFLDREGENILTQALNVEDVSITVNTSVLTVLLFLINLLNWTTTRQMLDILEDSVEAWLNSLDDFGEIAKEVSNALEAVIPNALAIQKVNYYLPYTNTLTPYSFEYLETDAEGNALNVQNVVPREPGPDYEFEPVYPDRPTDIDPGILDWEYPLPSQPSPTRPPDLLELPDKVLNGLRLSKDGRRTLEEQLEDPGAASRFPLAGHLLSEGFNLSSITWLSRAQVDLEKREVLARPVSQRSAVALRKHLDSLQGPLDRGERPDFLFAGKHQLPKPKTVLLDVLPYLGGRGGVDDTSSGEPGDQPVTPSETCSFDDSSTLSSKRGTALDPAWLGLSVNCVVVDQALDILLDSGAFNREGELAFGETLYDFKIIRMALSSRLAGKMKSRDGIPTATAHDLVVELAGNAAKTRYRVNLTVPIYPVKASVGCLPDTSVDEVFFNRSCIESMTGGSIPDSVYIDQLLYRHFVFLELASTDVSVQVVEVLEGENTVLAELVSREKLLVRLFETVLPDLYKVPLAFDPYYQLNPVISDYEAKGGWLNIYESYSLEL